MERRYNFWKKEMKIFCLLTSGIFLDRKNGISITWKIESVSVNESNSSSHSRLSVDLVL